MTINFEYDSRNSYKYNGNSWSQFTIRIEYTCNTQCQKSIRKSFTFS